MSFHLIPAAECVAEGGAPCDPAEGGAWCEPADGGAPCGFSSAAKGGTARIMGIADISLCEGATHG